MRKLSALNIRSIKHLCRHLGTSLPELDHIFAHTARYYHKRNRTIKGKPRLLCTPQGRLREIIDRLNQLLQRLEFDDSIQGGIRGKSTISNATPHLRKPVIIKLDLKDFFPRISNNMVYAAFIRAGCTPDVSRYLTKISTFEGHLPQGSPTSTIVSALVIGPMAKRISMLATQHNADYTQWVDDITISGPKHIEKLIPLIEKIISQSGFSPNIKKRDVVLSSNEQVVTGIRVNFQIDAPSEKFDQVKKKIEEIRKRKSMISSKEYASLSGRIRYIKKLNPGAGKYLGNQLNSLPRAHF